MSLSRRRAVRPGEPSCPRIQRESAATPGMSTIWRIRSLNLAQQLLRARHATTQAGFTAEAIPQGRLKHHPILVSDGPLHDEQRRKVARFFAPKVVARRYTTQMQDCADRLLTRAGNDAPVRLDELALLYTVEVTADVVGLTESKVPRMARRLVSFFNQPPADVRRKDLGRTRLQWMRAAVNGLLPVLRFHVADVRPAIRSRRRQRREDVISHLIDEGYTDVDILVECVTYGTAGMVTTREFIVMAAWHLLQDEHLRCRYLQAEEPERHGILNELIRLEPVVGHLYRRAQEPIQLSEDGDSWNIETGDLVDVCVRPSNADPQAVGEAPEVPCPGRDLPSSVNAAGLAFGDGEHRCPGQPLAILESDVLLRKLLTLNPRIIHEPKLGWDDLIEGYTLRGFELTW